MAVAAPQGRASLEGVGDVAQRSHAAIDGGVSLGRGGAAGAGARQWLGGRRRRPRAVLVRRLAGFERGAPGNAVGGERRPLSRADVEDGERLGHCAAVMIYSGD
jgi:hypothetical protein